MTMPQVPTTDDAASARMTEWLATVSYENDYAGQLPETETEDPSDDDGQSDDGSLIP